jgi:hypothetical protein
MSRQTVRRIRFRRSEAMKQVFVSRPWAIECSDGKLLMVTRNTPSMYFSRDGARRVVKARNLIGERPVRVKVTVETV